jgi:H+-translocating NAD(P) transhydrogenase subunit alpha
MRLGIPREVRDHEKRVAATPATVEKLIAFGYEVAIQKGAGARASFPDGLYEAAGAVLMDDAASIWSGSDMILKVRPPQELADGTHELDMLAEGKTILSLVFHTQNEDLVERLAAKKTTVLSLDKVPRITTAQKLDVLSSMGNISGYRAVVEAAGAYGGFFALQVTAAGRTNPAHVLVVGGGVAGLAALGAARALGAQVRVFDVRPPVREQVESLGGQFIKFEFDSGESGEGKGGYAKAMSDAFLKAEQDLLADNAAECDIVITTALIPNRDAPVLITEEAVGRMRPGSVIVDLAAERGGNCPLTVADDVIDHNGVTIIGHTDLPSRMPRQSSELFSMNVVHMMDELTGDDGFDLDKDNVIIRGMLIMEDGTIVPPPEVVNPSPQKKADDKPAAPTAPPKAVKKKAPKKKKKASKGHGHGGHGAASEDDGPDRSWIAVAIASVILMVLGAVAPTDFLQHLTVFLLACVVGWHVVWSVTAALHTPLMSVTNAISGIIVIGGMLLITGEGLTIATVLSMIAVLIASINIAGGFLVTQRMLRMFRRD